MPLPELLAPCGSPEAVEAAIAGGADAVYLGGSMLNARMKAVNFGDDILCRSIEKLHGRGVRAYVTLNTCVLDREIDEAVRYAGFLYQKAGADALIIADLGLARFIHSIFPDFAIHASTQASGHNSEAAKEFSKIGFSRMVCARELSGEDIKILVQKSPIEIEMFIHGALCVSYSGQCLMSSFIGGRSGNRGMCAQPCRMKYNGSDYPLSLKDNCLASHIPSLIESGVASLKIEGRMKSPSYVYTVTSVYRRLLCENRCATKEENDLLADVFSRGGFTDAYYTGKIGIQMNGFRSEDDKKSSFENKANFRDLNISLPKIINERKEIKIPDKIFITDKNKSKLPLKPVLSASFLSAEQIPKSHCFDIVYLPLESFDGRFASGVILPPVIFDKNMESVNEKLKSCRSLGAKYALCGNAGHIGLAKKHGFIVCGDFRLNIYNSSAAKYYAGLGLSELILSSELTMPQMRDISALAETESGEKVYILKSAVVYGRHPLMLMHKRVGSNLLRDRTGAVFPVIHRGAFDILYNSCVTYMLDQTDKLKDISIYGQHFIFTNENKSDVLKVISAAKNKLPPDKNIQIKRIPQK